MVVTPEGIEPIASARAGVDNRLSAAYQPLGRSMVVGAPFLFGLPICED
jgi:hypothetical protein